jgi:hypothetical protein
MIHRYALTRIGVRSGVRLFNLFQAQLFRAAKCVNADRFRVASLPLVTPLMWFRRARTLSARLWPGIDWERDEPGGDRARHQVTRQLLCHPRQVPRDTAKAAASGRGGSAALFQCETDCFALKQPARSPCVMLTFKGSR